jgi:rod shape-determining protein MreC
MGAALLLPGSFRAATLTFLRAPFTVTKTLVKIVLDLPRLPMLSQENADLQEMLTRRMVELATVRETLRHTNAAPALQAQPLAATGLMASIIGRSPIPTRHTILLDRGARHGLSEGGILLSPDGVVGRIVEVQPTTSLALLISDPDSRIAGLVERSRESGLLVGQGRGVCELRYLDAASDIAEGDRILTAGVGGAFPKGLPLGTVVSVIRKTETGAASAIVRPAAPLNQLEEVLCLPPSS